MSVRLPVYQIRRSAFLSLPLAYSSLANVDDLQGRKYSNNYALVGCVVYFGGSRSDMYVYKTGTYYDVQQFAQRYWPDGGERVFPRYGGVDTVEVWNVYDVVNCDCCGCEVPVDDCFLMADGQIWCPDCVDDDMGKYGPNDVDLVSNWLQDVVSFGNMLCGGDYDVEFNPSWVADYDG